MTAPLDLPALRVENEEETADQTRVDAMGSAIDSPTASTD